MSRSSFPTLQAPEVHITDVGRFLKCRMLWAFASPLRHNLEPARPNKHLLLGNWVHAALEAYYGGSRSAYDLLGVYYAAADRDLAAVAETEGEVPEEIAAYRALGEGMITHYALWAPGYDRFEVVATERKVALDFPHCRYTGKIDMLVRDEHGDVWIWEHKTYTQTPSAAVLGLSLQPALYLYAARQDPVLSQAGPIRGMIYNILHKRNPAIPETLKAGGLSKRANIGCTPQWYRHCLNQAGLDPAPYADFIATLDPWKLNTRHAITMTEERLGLAMICFHRAVAEMLGDPALYPADPIYTCGRCEYLPLCTQMLYGLAWEPLAQLSYRPRERAEDGVGEDSDD